MVQQKKNQIPPIYIVSGGKGIAGHTLVHSLIIQYPDNNIPVQVIPDIQSVESIVAIVTRVKTTGGVLTHTMVNSELRALLIQECASQGVTHIDMMGPLADYIENTLGLTSVSVPGLYRRINAQYFDRIDAIDFSMNHDDGLNPERLHEAEIILTGVSRTGKTPLSIYMSMFGWKVANVPLVRGINPPDELFKVDPQRVFGLQISPLQLIAHRAKRLRNMNDINNQDYIDQRMVNDELRFANQIFERGHFSVIHVTNKPIETTANEIIGIISERFGFDNRQKGPT